MEGIILVTVIVFLFMADWRTTIIVAIIIPMALLFAFLMLHLKGMSANLLSLGAVDFGIMFSPLACTLGFALLGAFSAGVPDHLSQGPSPP